MGEVHLTVKGAADCMLEKAGLSTNFVDGVLDGIGYFTQPASKGHHLSTYDGHRAHKPSSAT